MSSFNVPFRLKLQISLRGVRSVLLMPGFAAAFCVTFWIMLGALVWLTNWRVLFDYLSGGSSTADRFNFFLSGYESLLTNFSLASAAVLVLFALLAAVNTAVAFFVISKSFKQAASSSTKSFAGIVAAAIGAGCAACGTSFLAPLLTGVSGALSITLTMVVGIVANIAGLVLLVYSLYRLGQAASTAIALE